MVNFEIIDNYFQVCMLLVGAIYAGTFAWKNTIKAVQLKRSGEGVKAELCEKYANLCMSLAFGYVSFMMGTLFYVTHLAILSDISRMFYVSEISWLAGYMFFISVELMREEGMKKQSSTPFVWLPVVGCIYLYIIIYKSEWLSLAVVVFLATLTVLTVMAIRGIHRNRAAGRSVTLDVLFLASVAWQLLLYYVSGYMDDFTRFNLYFAVDIMLTLNLMSIAPVLVRECMREADAV